MSVIGKSIKGRFHKLEKNESKGKLANFDEEIEECRIMGEMSGAIINEKFIISISKYIELQNG